MGRALMQAAAEAGLPITLLDTCCLTGGLAPDGTVTPLSPVQQRFSDGDAGQWADRLAALGPDKHGMLAPHARAGVAIHSVRPIPPSQMHPIVEWSHHFGAPLHAHLSEQPAENEACLAAYGATPARVLDDAGALGPRSTMVHATHLTHRDIELLVAAAAASACARRPRPSWPTASARRGRWPRRAARSRWAVTATR